MKAQIDGGRLRLVPHPSSRRALVESLHARASVGPDGALGVTFVLRAPMDRIAVPDPGDPRRVDGLWRHTCFECFVRGAGESYSEFNFSPSGEWAAYSFRRYRDAESLPPAFDPHIAVKRAAAALELHAVVPGCVLPARPRHGAWSVGLCAVIEEACGDLSYWALRHPPGKPDFHHAEAFALLL